MEAAKTSALIHREKTAFKVSIPECEQRVKLVFDSSVPKVLRIDMLLKG